MVSGTATFASRVTGSRSKTGQGEVIAVVQLFFFVGRKLSRLEHLGDSSCSSFPLPFSLSFIWGTTIKNLQAAPDVGSFLRTGIVSRSTSDVSPKLKCKGARAVAAMTVLIT